MPRVDPMTCPDCRGTGRQHDRVRDAWGFPSTIDTEVSCTLCWGAKKICPHCRKGIWEQYGLAHECSEWMKRPKSDMDV